MKTKCMSAFYVNTLELFSTNFCLVCIKTCSKIRIYFLWTQFLKHFLKTGVYISERSKMR